MTGNDGRHDVHRVRALLARTTEALAELRSVRATDEAATDAMQAIRLAAHTLETLWLPALDDLEARS